MQFPLAFNKDPLFSNLSNPLIKIETRLTQKKQRFWIWKEADFFWFWNEDEPDFFGVLFEGTEHWSFNKRWFAEASSTTDSKHLHQILHTQLHHGEWARAITVEDPRLGKDGLWRVIWRRRNFLLQNAFTGRAIRFFPETNWSKKSWQWKALNFYAHDAQFFAELFWSLLSNRRGRLQGAFDFLELPTEDQRNPLRFGCSDAAKFTTILRAALIVEYARPENLDGTFALRFHYRTLQPICFVWPRIQFYSIFSSNLCTTNSPFPNSVPSIFV